MNANTISIHHKLAFTITLLAGIHFKTLESSKLAKFCVFINVFSVIKSVISLAKNLGVVFKKKDHLCKLKIEMFLKLILERSRIQ